MPSAIRYPSLYAAVSANYTEFQETIMAGLQSALSKMTLAELKEAFTPSGAVTQLLKD